MSETTPSGANTIPGAVAEEAAKWIVRRDAGALTAEEAQAFEAWLATPAHREAFGRLDSLWHFLDDVPQHTAETALPPIRRFAMRRSAKVQPKSTTKARRWTASAIAASLALAMLGAMESWPTAWRADYATGVGERRMVTLEDGSTVMLDGSSAIALDFSERTRKVRLLQGSALFKVSANPARPFTVEAAGGSATALGTAFAVRAADGLAELVVTQHRVQAVGGGRSAVVGEGQRVDFGANALSSVEPAGAGETAWTRGRLVVVNRPLGEVIAEIARHRHGYLAVSGSASDLKVSGVYDLDHPLAAIDSIERSLGLRSIRLSNRIIVLHR